MRTHITYRARRSGFDHSGRFVEAGDWVEKPMDEPVPPFLEPVSGSKGTRACGYAARPGRTGQPGRSGRGRV
ncbi:hypothetical protein [Desulfohalovibrio reitneri]|uniref:hypothetical protein n=1 Tax=Desulfohalovibrio reitneri TaxID=1307759 RepID=UPI0004A75FAA|nr:hypothetical protein [Desulfohalovibrio reitneri]